MKGPAAAAESLRGWVVWARGSRRQRLDLRDDSSPAMPHSNVCTDCVQWGKVEYLQTHNTHPSSFISALCVSPSMQWQLFMCLWVCQYEKSREQLTYMGVLPIRSSHNFQTGEKRAGTLASTTLSSYSPIFCIFCDFCFVSGCDV